MTSYLRSECDRDVFVTDEIEDIFALMFADDIASVSDTIIRLQRQINLIERFCESVDMTLNLIKTKLIVFQNGGIVKQTDKWYYSGEIIASFKYGWSSDIVWYLRNYQFSIRKVL